MKLFDATLDLAAFAKGTEDYVISRVNDRRLTCNDLSGRVAEFGGGTIWFQSGECAGQFGRIRSGAAQTLELMDSFTEGYAAGDEITIAAWLEFDTQKLINAINSVLRMYKIVKYNEVLEYDPDADYYELPEGVTEDIRKVVLMYDSYLDKAQPAESHYWRVEDGKLYLYDVHTARYQKGAKIRIAYADYHGAVGKDDVISPQVDPLYLRYMSWLYLCRNLIQNTHKDNLVATDMYNEAKIYERDNGRLPNKRLPIRTMTFPQWG